MNKNREYVLLSVKWTRNSNGYLIFWGHQTEDNEERSYGGYTMDLETCEKYTKEELKKEKNFYFYDGKKTLRQLVRQDSEGTWAVKISDLEKFGKKKTIIWL